MSLMDKMKQGMAKATEVGEKAKQFAQLKLSITTLDSKLSDRYSDLGYRCYELHLAQAVRAFDDEKVQKLCQQIADIHAELKTKKWELEKMQANGDP
ncbi:MAG: hypothetical protein AUJ92_02215 [Armatimonadetes bacterium CG2_30_59_28]|nr:hypothetical protein [Armatimonadota bacterium]OIO98064.1 MAG: hypothetical protein AUJ92_02215 [Armatimonadetes bacterium CG2_30_59_28]PIU67370.1 MAG: hypothetical protein COS85_00910 [Armatimonadetes bacterium CG07_land_8_20_14_0_80_59_28]PIX41961.1 MAG: hypothetical protein COZ56_10480 [Armatimonadetes bacterium CG_4_8_14_3_um_filter_58_9]PIY41883.1 MAG: hypothetical protein COZ05_15020 [Armatimonadetes bacterium CG_4_10_14_3_um_filter_59_10]PJB73798.1 MAG: hypothetical protein CO095_054